jgi:hypothetical protein
LFFVGFFVSFFKFIFFPTFSFNIWDEFSKQFTRLEFFFYFIPLYFILFFKI